MKKLLAAAALATALASPAFAQAYDPDVGSGNITPPLYAHSPESAQAGDAGAYAQAYPQVGHGVVMRQSVTRHSRARAHRANTGEW